MGCGNVMTTTRSVMDGSWNLITYIKSTNCYEDRCDYPNQAASFIFGIEEMLTNWNIIVKIYDRRRH